MWILFYGQIFMMFFMIGFFYFKFENTICLLIFILYKNLYENWVIKPMEKAGKL